MSKSVFRVALLFAAAHAACAFSQSAPYPSRPVRLVVPFAPGGTPGLVSRTPVRGEGVSAAGFHTVATTAAQPYPTRPLRLIVPFAPGGGLEITARSIGQKLTDRYGQSVIVDNRPGAATIVGTEIAS